MSVPSWVNMLSTASIRADMAAADVNGRVTYSGLEHLIADLDAKVAASGTGLTAAELSDLRMIARNLNNGMSTSSYLTTVFNNLVNGNPENATWTGGNRYSTYLGNLGVGSSAAQLAELNGKWFLGTDLPSSYVAMSGDPTFSVWYSNSTAPLFGASGPSMNDVNQGYLGDCYLLSSLAEVANHNPSLISSMITSNGNGTYGVRGVTAVIRRVPGDLASSAMFWLDGGRSGPWRHHVRRPHLIPGATVPRAGACVSW
jgi:hypothetical protein